MKIEDLQQTTIQRQMKNGYEEIQVKNAWVAAQSYGEFEAILFKSIKGKQSQKTTQGETIVVKLTTETIKENKINQSDDEDENLKKAIEASKNIEESEQYQGGMKLRKSGIPCGLYNMGSTCYFNSLIQTYFFNQDFYQAVLDWNPSEDQSDLDFKISQSFLFLESLKTIFIKMVCSNFQCVNPEEIFSFINNPDGINIDCYQQQDIAEFNHILLEKIETAMLFKKQTNLSEEISDENTFQLLKQNFFGKLEYEIIVQNQAVENYQEEFNFIQIDVSSNKLQDGLVNFLNSKVEFYKNNQNQLVNTTKKCKFIKLPSVFQFQIQRVKFSDYLETTKDTRELYFDVVLDVKDYCSPSLFMEDQIDYDENTKSSLESMLINLQGTYNFYQIQGSQQKEYQQFQMQKQQNIDQILQTLTQSINFIKQKIEQRNKKKNSKQTQPKQINTRYHLQSIIIHQGTAQYGHYYAFIKDFYLNKWFKFNDFLVEEISEQEVLAISYGKQKTKHESSTYLIMYLNENKVLNEKNSKFPIRSFLTSKDQDFLNDFYGRFAKEKQNQQVEKILKDNTIIQSKSNNKQNEKIFDLPLNSIIQQYKKNYDQILLKEKQLKQNQQYQTVSFPLFLNHFALFQYQYYKGKHDNIKWYFIDLAIKLKSNDQYGVFIGNCININTQQQISYLINQDIQFNEKYQIRFSPEKSEFFNVIKKYQLSLKVCIFCNEVIKYYYKNQYYESIKALQALVNISRQLDEDSDFLEFTIYLRFQIPYKILSKIIQQKNQEQLYEIIHFIIAFEKQEFFEFKKDNYKNFSFSLLQSLILKTASYKRFYQYFQPLEKQLQEAKQELMKQQEIQTNCLQDQIQLLLQKCDPKQYDLEKIDDSFFFNCQENFYRFIQDQYILSY